MDKTRPLISDADKLRAAARIMAVVARNMNRATSLCSGCGCPRYVNFSEFSMAIEIEAMVRKCEKFALALGETKDVSVGTVSP